MRSFFVFALTIACGTTETEPLDGDIAPVDATMPIDQASPPDSAPDIATEADASVFLPVIIAAGDISGTSIGNQKPTSDLIFGKGYDAVLILGDIQYPVGSLTDFNSYYDPTWGRFKATTYPAPGNHEYGTPNAAGYFTYFGANAHDPTKGYYSYDLGDWHLIALNTNDNNCGIIACNASSAQVTWLKADLAASTKKCTLAYWHHPRFNSGTATGNFLAAQALWDTLYAAGAEIVLNGHEHIYERFDPQTPTAAADPVTGIRQFTVGTGGIGFHSVGTPKPNSVVRQASSYGVLKLTLKQSSYDWEFLAVAPSTFTDTGTGTCH